MNKRSFEGARMCMTVAVVTFLALGTAAWPATSEERPVVDVICDGSGTTPIDQSLAAHATVVLTKLKETNRIPASAAASVFCSVEPCASHRQHIGVRVPEGTPEGSEEWMNAPFITVEDARISVTHFEDTAGRFIWAGYEYPAPGEQRKPWLLVVSPEESVPAKADFLLPENEQWAADLTLLEVVAIDSNHIYFDALSTGGDDLIVRANYSVLP